jgi:hypothetical protein
MQIIEIKLFDDDDNELTNESAAFMLQLIN